MTTEPPTILSAVWSIDDLILTVIFDQPVDVGGMANPALWQIRDSSAGFIFAGAALSQTDPTNINVNATPTISPTISDDWSFQGPDPGQITYAANSFDLPPILNAPWTV